jgi:hypothetical protein
MTTEAGEGSGAPDAARSFRLVVEFDGSEFDGWQIQGRGERTVQGCLVEAAARVIGVVAAHPNGPPATPPLPAAGPPEADPKAGAPESPCSGSDTDCDGICVDLRYLRFEMSGRAALRQFGRAGESV